MRQKFDSSSSYLMRSLRAWCADYFLIYIRERFSTIWGSKERKEGRREREREGVQQTGVSFLEFEMRRVFGMSYFT